MELIDDVMGREPREHKCDKSRCRSDARNAFPEYLLLLLLLVKFAVPLGLQKPPANPGFRQRVTDGARTRDLL
jgi:hypothetical protein